MESTVKVYSIYFMLISLIFTSADDALSCDRFIGEPKKYELCTKSQQENSDDCVDCSTQKAPRDAFYERERSTGDYILEGLGILAGPAAMFGSVYLQTNAMKHGYTAYKDMYMKGQDACTMRFNNFTGYYAVKNDTNGPKAWSSSCRDVCHLIKCLCRLWWNVWNSFGD